MGNVELLGMARAKKRGIPWLESADKKKLYSIEEICAEVVYLEDFIQHTIPKKEEVYKEYITATQPNDNVNSKELEHIKHIERMRFLLSQIVDYSDNFTLENKEEYEDKVFLQNQLRNFLRIKTMSEVHVCYSRDSEDISPLLSPDRAKQINPLIFDLQQLTGETSQGGETLTIHQNTRERLQAFLLKFSKIIASSCHSFFFQPETYYAFVKKKSLSKRICFVRST